LRESARSEPSAPRSRYGSASDTPTPRRSN
jgi:hypothetical protein